MFIASIIEYFFGEWVCVIAAVPDSRFDILIVCHKHTVTGRVKGYVCNGKDRYILETKVVREHIATYGRQK